jgi:hypothetical protein
MSQRARSAPSEENRAVAARLVVGVVNLVGAQGVVRRLCVPYSTPCAGYEDDFVFEFGGRAMVWRRV